MGNLHPLDRFPLEFWDNCGIDVLALYSELCLWDNRRLLLFGEFTQTKGQTLSSMIKVFNREDRTRSIELFINSWGGTIETALEVYETMKDSRATVETICVGRAESLASLILAAGSPNCRGGFPNSFVTITPPHLNDGERKQILGLYAQLTGKSESLILQDIQKSDFLMTVEEAIAYGILDRIVV